MLDHRLTRPTASQLVNVLAALAAGALLFLSFPPRTLSWCAPLGIALLVWALRRGLSLRAGFGLGLLAGLTFFVALLPWTGIYVGPLPWLALSSTLAVFVGVFGVATRLVATLPVWPLWTAAAWSLTEWGRANFPFGGFPWGRLAFSQADSVLLPFASLGGAPLLTFAVALLGTTTIAVLEAARTQSRRGFVAALAVMSVILTIAAVLWPTLNSTDRAGTTTTVAAIQGSVPRLGLDFNSQRRAVLDNHARQTHKLAEHVRAGVVAQPQVVIWPENSSDIDPFRNSDAYEIIDAAAHDVDAPILVGAVLINDDRTGTNSVVVWDPLVGPQDRHDKRIIQPFGEYLPMRSFFRLFSKYADQAGHFVAGHGNGVVRAAGIPIAIATCYEVVFDRALTESVRAGAQLIAVPTNNATFGKSDMTYQQLAMSRVRAVEHDRYVVVAATSGVSAIVRPDGALLGETELLKPASLVLPIELRSRITLATRLGSWPELVLIVVAIAAIGWAIALRRRRGDDSHTATIDASRGEEVDV